MNDQTPLDWVGMMRANLRFDKKEWFIRPEHLHIIDGFLYLSITALFYSSWSADRIRVVILPDEDSAVYLHDQDFIRLALARELNYFDSKISLDSNNALLEEGYICSVSIFDLEYL